MFQKRRDIAGDKKLVPPKSDYQRASVSRGHQPIRFSRRNHRDGITAMNPPEGTLNRLKEITSVVTFD
jgi:hypothetical protein